MSTMQQIMLRLAKSNQICFIHRPLSIISTFSGIEEIPVLQQVRDFAAKPKEVGKNITCAMPPMVFPLRHTRFFNSINSLILNVWLERLLKGLAFSPTIVWAFSSEASKIVGKLSKNVISIYHCIDDYCESGFWWNSKRDVQKREIDMLRAVDMVFTTSRTLWERQIKINPNCHYVPNAADFELFSKATNGDTKATIDIRSLKKPVIGYVGMFNSDRINLDWIQFVARKTDFSFVFIGKKQVKNFDMSRIEQLKNVHFIPFQEQKNLPGYFKSIDVFMMPSIKSKNNEAVFPLKLFEYLASGKPIVATRIKELEPFDKVISLVDTALEFLGAIEEGVKENNPAMVEERMRISRENTWDARIDTISKIVQDYAQKR